MAAVEKPLIAARAYILRCSLEGGLAVDATTGNGHDTVFLARLVGESGQVIAFDIQQAALDQTRKRLAAAGLEERVRFVLNSHEHAEAYIQGSISAAMFNLGYLPGGDQHLTTLPETTLKALAILLDKLKPGGIVTLVVYTGHAGGYEEKEAVLDFCSRLDQQRYTALHYQMINQANLPPSLVVIERHF